MLRYTRVAESQRECGTLGKKRFMGFARRLINTSIFAFLTCQNLCLGQTSALSFPPFERWKSAILGGNVAALKGLYSQAPAAQLKTPAGTVDATTDIAFWVELKSQKLQFDVIAYISPRPGMAELQFRAEVHPPGQNAHYFSEEQLWQQQGGPWRLVAARRTRPTTLRLPVSMDNHIYPATDARSEIQQALADAAKKHERIIVIFGADWCYDCHVLDAAFHRPDLQAALRGNFEVVHVDVGEGDKNQDLMQEYRVPMKKGIPALAVLDSDGKLLYSQQNGEFENARALGPDDLLRFLNKWKPPAR